MANATVVFGRQTEVVQCGMERIGMVEYIDKGVALDLVATEFGHGESGLEKVYHEIFRFPTANVRENVKAKWVPADEKPYIRKHFHTMVCSNCRKRKEGKWNFCPNCGARMNEEDGDT